MRLKVRAFVGLGLAMLGVGLFLALGSSAPDDYGWFAFTPGENDVELSDDLVMVTRGRIVGCLVGVVGLVVTTTTLGYAAGRRRAATSED